MYASPLLSLHRMRGRARKREATSLLQQQYAGSCRGDADNLYRLVEVRPSPEPSCDCRLGDTLSHSQKLYGELDGKATVRSSTGGVQSGGDYLYHTAPFPCLGEPPRFLYAPAPGGDSSAASPQPQTCDILNDVPVPVSQGYSWGTPSSLCKTTRANAQAFSSTPHKDQPQDQAAFTTFKSKSRGAMTPDTPRRTEDSRQVSLDRSQSVTEAEVWKLPITGEIPEAVSGDASCDVSPPLAVGRGDQQEVKKRK